MALEFKKVKDITEAQLEALKAQGWEFAGEVKDKTGKGTGVLRFQREQDGAPSAGGRILSPKSVAQRMRVNKN